MTFTSQPKGSRGAAAFAQIPNATLRDRRLTARARGVLAYMLSHDESFQMTKRTLLAEFPEGRDALERVIRELKDAGYVKVDRPRDDASRFVGSTYTVFEVAQDPDDADSPGHGFPGTRETSAVENGPYKNTIPKNTKSKNTNPKAGESVVLMIDSHLKDLGVLDTSSTRDRKAAAERLDVMGVQPEEARRVLAWVAEDSFWRATAVSVPHIVREWPRLKLKAEGGGAHRGPASDVLAIDLGSASSDVLQIEAGE